MPSLKIITHEYIYKLIICIWKFYPQQNFSNQKSLRLQHALKQRAFELWWSEGAVSCDLILPRTALEYRDGFKESMTQAFKTPVIQEQRIPSGYIYTSYLNYMISCVLLELLNIIHTVQNSAIKLSFSSLRDLMSLAEECTLPCHSPPLPSTRNYPSINNKKFSPILT